MLGTDRVVYPFLPQRKRPSRSSFVMVSIGVMFIYQRASRGSSLVPMSSRFDDGERFIIRARDFKEMTGLERGADVLRRPKG